MPNKCKNRKLPFSTKVQKHKLEHDNFKTYNVISQCFYYENRFVKQAPQFILQKTFHQSSITGQNK